MQRLGCMRGTGPRATGTGGCVFFRCLARDRPSHYGDRVRFFVVRGPVLRNRSLILAILIILAILLQTRELLRSYGPFLLVAPMFYRHSGLPDFFSLILAILINLGNPASDGTRAKDRSPRDGRHKTLQVREDLNVYRNQQE